MEVSRGVGTVLAVTPCGYSVIQILLYTSEPTVFASSANVLINHDSFLQKRVQLFGQNKNKKQSTQQSMMIFRPLINLQARMIIFFFYDLGELTF